MDASKYALTAIPIIGRKVVQQKNVTVASNPANERKNSRNVRKIKEPLCVEEAKLRSNAIPRRVRRRVPGYGRIRKSKTEN